MRTDWRLVCLIVCGFATPVVARDLHVDPSAGDDDRDGIAAPVKSISRAIRLAQPGDTIHLQPRVYRDWAAFYDKSGEPDQPIVLDGHGATLEGCDPLDPAGWQEIEPGLFRHDDLLPLTDAIIDRWFFLQDGRKNHMRRCSKGPSEPLKTPAELKAGEWTFVKDAPRTATARPGYIYGSFFLRIPAGQSLAKANLQVPYRPAGVLMHGRCRHLIVRNLTATHPYNDGFNLSDCREIRLENIRAFDCGDDGISAHGDCLYHVEGFTSIGNATGICDTGSSETHYRRVFIRDCAGFDLYFLDTGRYFVTDALVQSSAARSLYLQGREKPAPPCCVTLENVLLERGRPENDLRVGANCRLTMRRSTILNVDVQATGGDIDAERCIIAGNVSGPPARKPTLHLWPEATWHGRENWYDWSSIRAGKLTFSAEEFPAFQQLTRSDLQSQWKPVVLNGQESAVMGADPARLPAAQP